MSTKTTYTGPSCLIPSRSRQPTPAAPLPRAGVGGWPTRRPRPPVFDHHPRFRNPPVPPPAIGEYRDAFRQGYERFLHPGPPPPPPGY